MQLLCAKKYKSWIAKKILARASAEVDEKWVLEIKNDGISLFFLFLRKFNSFWSFRRGRQKLGFLERKCFQNKQSGGLFFSYIFRFSSVQFFSDEKWVVTNKITFKISNQGSVFVDISVQFSLVHFRRKMGSNKQNYVQNKQSGVCFRIYFSCIGYFRICLFISWKHTFT